MLGGNTALSQGETLRNSKHCLHKDQKGRSNSENPLMRTYISHKKNSQAIPRDRIRSERPSDSGETPVRSGLRRPREHRGDTSVKGVTRKLRTPILPESLS